MPIIWLPFSSKLGLIFGNYEPMMVYEVVNFILCRFLPNFVALTNFSVLTTKVR